MLKQFFAHQISFIGWLPLSLILVTYFGPGIYYETNDDILISFLLRGIIIEPPLGDLSLYFHGLSPLLTGLYQIAPAFPWYGMVLYTLLFVATSLAFRLLYAALKEAFTVRQMYLVLVLFYLVAWYEHAFWFNYTRLPILLAGLALLNAWFDYQINTGGNKYRMPGYTALFLLALCIRPSSAAFGLILVWPIFIFRIKSYSRQMVKRVVFILLPFVVTGLAFAGWMAFTNNPAAAQYRQADILKSQVLDYGWCCPPSADAKNRLILTGINHWFLADKVSKQFVLEQLPPDWDFFLHAVLPAKSFQLGKHLLLDQFMALGTILLLLIWFMLKKERRITYSLILYNGYFWGIIMSAGILLKMPPRLLSPALSLWVLMHVIIVKDSIKLYKLPLWMKGIGMILIAVQLYKIAHRAGWQQQRQAHSEQVMEQVRTQYPGKLVVTAGLQDELRALSPFKNYNFGNRQIVLITGWQTLDPHYPAYWQQLAGSPELAETIWRLSKGEKVIWVWSPEFSTFLKAYLHTFYGQTVTFTSLGPVMGTPEMHNLHFFRVNRSR